MSAQVQLPMPAYRGRALYLWLLTWAFTLFNTVRVFSYLPTLWAIHRSGDSSQHAIATWFVWCGSNLTMALWLYENNGRRFDRAVGMNMCNAAMCFATLCLVLYHRF